MFSVPCHAKSTTNKKEGKAEAFPFLLLYIHMNIAAVNGIGVIYAGNLLNIGQNNGGRNTLHAEIHCLAVQVTAV